MNVLYVHGFFWFIYFLFEVRYERRTKLSHEVLTEYYHISKHYNPDIDNAIVHLSSKHPKYYPIYDSYFNIQADTARLSRKVQYCQYEESCYIKKDSHGVERQECTYSKGWYSYQISSISFKKWYLYSNPTRKNFKQPNYIKSFSIGDYTINESLLSDLGSTNLFHLPQEQIKAFEKSKAFREENFRYIGGGTFFSPYTYKSIEDRRSSMRSWWCTPGDVYVQFNTFNPQKVTVLGFKNGTNIIRNDKNRLSYHYVGSGLLTVPELLNKQAKFTRIAVYVLRVVNVVILNLFKFDIYFLITDCGVMALITLLARGAFGTLTFINLPTCLFVIFASFGIFCYGYMYVKKHQMDHYMD